MVEMEPGTSQFVFVTLEPSTKNVEKRGFDAGEVVCRKNLGEVVEESWQRLFHRELVAVDEESVVGGLANGNPTGIVSENLYLRS